MATTELYVPSGEGKVWAPVGSEEWAKNMRLRMTTMVKGLNDEPERFVKYLRLFEEHRGWTLLTDRRGKRFESWKDLCETPQPHGLGKPAAEVYPLLVQAVGEKKAALMTTPPDRRETREKDVGGRFVATENHSGPGDTNGDSPSEETEKRNRAILRAPSEIQRIYCDDLVSQKVAVALGPVKQTPEKAAKIREATNEAVAIVEAKNPLDPEARRAVKREVDAKIRDVLGSKPPATTFATLLDKILRLSSEDRASLVCEVIDGLDEAHVHRVREALDSKGS